MLTKKMKRTMQTKSQMRISQQILLTSVTLPYKTFFPKKT